MPRVNKKVSGPGIPGKPRPKMGHKGAKNGPDPRPV
jgi:hypothetical protein